MSYIEVETMMTCLLNNLELIGILILMYVGAAGANILLGMYNNISNLKERFSKEKLIAGLTRCGIVLVGSLLITVIISLLPDILKALGVQTDANLFDGISIVAIAGVLSSVIVRYLKDAVSKFYSILYGKSEEIEE